MLPASGVSWPTIMRKRVVLPAPFGPMTPTMPPGGSANERLSMSRLSPNPLESPWASTTTSPGRDVDLVRVGALLVVPVLGEELLVLVEAGLALGLAGARAHADPLELVLQ